MIILADRQDELNVVNEERQVWLQKVLVALGADAEVIKNNTIDAKNHISSLGLDVLLKPEGEIDIIRFEHNEDGEEIEDLVAQWKQPELILIKKENEKYYEIHIKEWARPFQMTNLGD